MVHVLSGRMHDAPYNISINVCMLIFLVFQIRMCLLRSIFVCLFVFSFICNFMVHGRKWDINVFVYDCEGKFNYL